MKTYNSNILKSGLIMTSLTVAFTMIMISCNQDTNTMDSKEQAENRNEAKFSGKKEDNAEFLVAVAEINLEEIELGRLAQQKSATPEVITLGKMMESEHKKALEEVKALASKKQITIPFELTDNSKRVYNTLNNKSGIDFDLEYCNMMVKGHENAIRIFEKATTDSKDSEIQSWAEKMLIKLRTHLDHSITCQEKCVLMKSNS